MKLLITVSICLCAVTLVASAKEKNKLEKICKDKAEVPVDDDVLKEGFKAGIYISMVKKADSAGLAAKNPPEDKRKWNEKICFDVTADGPLGELHTVGVCKFNRTSYLSCVIVGPDSRGSGDKWVTKSDNQTYAVFIGCVSNKTPFWQVMSTVPELEEGTEEEILVHLEGMGFKRADAAEKGEDIRGTLMKEKDCGKDDGGVNKKKPATPVGDLTDGLV